MKEKVYTPEARAGQQPASVPESVQCSSRRECAPLEDDYNTTYILQQLAYLLDK